MCGLAGVRVCWHVFTVMSLVPGEPGATVCQLTSVPTSPPLSISISPSQLSQIMSGINENNVCVPGDPDCTRTVPRPGILNMSTSPVTIITVVRGQISDLDVVLNILVYDAERLFIELMQLTTVSFDMIE